MKFLKQSLVVILFFVFQNSALAQVYTFKASSLSILERNEKGAWGKWSDFKKAQVLITFDAKKDRFIVNSRDIQLYKITAYMQKVSNENDEVLGFECEDNDGAVCMIMIVTRKKEKNRKQFYINYRDLKMVYNIYDTQ